MRVQKVPGRFSPSPSRPGSEARNLNTVLLGGYKFSARMNKFLARQVAVSAPGNEPGKLCVSLVYLTENNNIVFYHNNF